MSTYKKILDYVIWIFLIFLLIFKVFSLIDYSNYNTNLNIDSLIVNSITEKDIINIIGELPKENTYELRDKSQITTIVIHHTASDESDPEKVAIVGIERFGYGHSYHYEIDSLGNIYQTNWLSNITAHCKENNSVSIGVVLDGNFESQNPTEQQVISLIELCKFLKITIPTITEIEGHNYYNRKTDCPGKNLNLNEIKQYIFDKN